MRAMTDCENSLPAHDTRGASQIHVQSAHRLHGPSGFSRAPRVVQAAVIFSLFCLGFVTSAHAQGWGSQPAKPAQSTGWQTAKPAPQAPSATQPASQPATLSAEPAATQPTVSATLPAQPIAPTGPVVKPAPALTANTPGTPSQSFYKNLSGYLTIDLLLYMGIAMVFMGAIMWLVQKTRSTLNAGNSKTQTPTQAGFTVDEIEKLKDQGLLSPSEYTRALSRAKTAGPTTDNQAPPADKKRKGPDEPPPTAPGLYNPSPDPKSPPSGSSPDPRNGELW
jgi:hypothetical protein